MLSTPKAVPSTKLTPKRLASHRSSHSKSHTPSPSSSHDSPPKDHSFMHRFRLNQHELQFKFKKFVLKQKLLFPKTLQKLNQTFLTEDAQEIQDIRQVRKEKQQLLEEMKQTMNESQYYMHRSREFQKTCYQLERRMKRVQSIRQQRKEEVVRVEDALRSISESIHQEKRRFRDIIKASKDNLQRSKLLCSRRKLTQAVSVRNESQLFRSRIHEQRLYTEKYNRHRYISVKAEEQKAELSVSRVIESKMGQAQEVKLERLFRELAEKEEVKIDSEKVKQRAGSIITRYKNKTVELQQRINRYRKSLGEQQPTHTPRITLLKFQNKRYNTEQNQFSTKSGFLTASKQVNYADEPFDD